MKEPRITKQAKETLNNVFYCGVDMVLMNCKKLDTALMGKQMVVDLADGGNTITLVKMTLGKNIHTTFIKENGWIRAYTE